MSIKTESKIENCFDYFIQDHLELIKEEDVFQNYKDKKLLTIVDLLPKFDFVTGPASQPFTLLEDMIILIVSKPYIRRKYLEHTLYVSGSALTLQFWTKINEVLSINRSSDSMRSRYNRVLAQIHPKEYDQYIQLLKKKNYYCHLKYSRNDQEKYLVIKSINTKPLNIKPKIKKKNKNHQLYITKCLNNQKLPKPRYLSKEYYEEKQLVRTIVETPKYQEQKNFVGEWIDVNMENLKKLKTKAYLELTEITLQLEEIDQLNI